MNALAKARKFPELASVLNDVMFTCYSGIKRPIHVSLNRSLSKLPSTFVRAFVEERLTPLNSLKLCTQRFWQSKANLSKMVAFHC